MTVFRPRDTGELRRRLYKHVKATGWLPTGIVVITMFVTLSITDTVTAAGKCFLDMLGVFAELETNLRRERQHRKGESERRLCRQRAPIND